MIWMVKSVRYETNQWRITLPEVAQKHREERRNTCLYNGLWLSNRNRNLLSTVEQNDWTSTFEDIEKIRRVIFVGYCWENDYPSRFVSEFFQFLQKNAGILLKMPTCCSKCRHTAQNADVLPKMPTYCSKYRYTAQNAGILTKMPTYCSECRHTDKNADMLIKMSAYRPKFRHTEQNADILTKIPTYCSKCRHTAQNFYTTTS